LEAPAPNLHFKVKFILEAKVIQSNMQNPFHVSTITFTSHKSEFNHALSSFIKTKKMPQKFNSPGKPSLSLHFHDLKTMYWVGGLCIYTSTITTQKTKTYLYIAKLNSSLETNQSHNKASCIISNFRILSKLYSI
jgi:hypothetical protein